MKLNLAWYHLFWAVLLYGCAPSADKLPDLFEDSSRREAVAGSWQSNRRFYLLADYFTRQGFRRCIAYRPAAECNFFPRMVQQNFTLGQPEAKPYKTVNSRINYGKNLILEPRAKMTETYILDYTGSTSGSRAAQYARELLLHLAEDKAYLQKMPRVIFAEGTEGVRAAKEKFSPAILLLQDGK